MLYSPVFIVGMPRSGTTLLSRLIETHTRYSALPESHFFTKFLWRISISLSMEEMICRWNNYADKCNWGLSKICSNTNDLDSNEDWFGKCRELFLLWSAQELDIKQSDVCHTGWVDNTPAHIESIELINKIFPEAKILFIYRDPRAVHNSLLNVPWNSGNPYVNAARWCAYIDIMERYDEGSKYKKIRYEDLLVSPESIIYAIAGWLSVEYSPYDSSTKRSDSFDSEKEPWKARVDSAIDINRIDSWKDNLREEDVSIIESLSFRKMYKYGYEVVSGREAGCNNFVKFWAVIIVRLRIMLYRKFLSLIKFFWNRSA